MTAALADVEGVSVSYGRRAALRSVTFSLGGKVTGLLGPNGAGKSTLMNVLTTRLAPKAGTVSVLGHDAATRAGRSRSDSVWECCRNECGWCARCAYWTRSPTPPGPTG